MNDDRSWLKDPILPRPPAVPRFSAAELRLVEDERPSSVMRVASRKPRASKAEAPPLARTSATRAVRAKAGQSEAPQSRRIA